MHRSPFLSRAVVVAMVVSTSARSAVVQDPRSSVQRVLFIGNSLTSRNDLPLLVEAMSAESSTPLRCEAMTRDDFSIEDHWNAGASKRIREGDWKYVVLQQGPSSLDASRANLREWTKKIADEIRAVNAMPALYMVWPDRSRLAFMPRVAESYRLASVDVSGVLLPVGEVWLRAWERDATLDLYGPDQFHPSKVGTYAAAATIVARLIGTAPESLKARYRLRNGDDYAIDPAKAATIRAAVAAVIPPATP